ncbi:DNA repair protein RecO [Rhabdobacter roseus]|uniref:DNA repair protein RecO n=1 Tax=Rhabdobacter roseus TaxID=1655419 RepID=A0A840TRZ3_9BACT|nr:DNA repair protein RecO [Rhabdobacter roseus]MBB5286701.1 DNA repair protein RecO (recombination protein O) [Rhabdobacter roseus]
MLHKTRGIALSYIRYRESSIIAKIYTEAFGIQSYIVNSVRSSRAKSNRIALFQPLTLLDLVVYHKPNREEALHRISEIKCRVPFHSLPFEVIKSSLALFITELLGKTLREEESNEPLFQFIEDSVRYLDEAEKGYQNFHLHFLLQLAAYLGFGLDSSQGFEEELTQRHYPHRLDAAQREALLIFLAAPYGTPAPLDASRRAVLLEMILFFYNIHLDSLGEIKSLEVLREVLH